MMPGGTPINPSIRLYNYNSSKILDYAQYHVNLTKLDREYLSHNLRPQNNSTPEPEWELYYKAKELYGLNDLSAKSMLELYRQLNSNDTEFQRYYLLNSAGINHGICNITCKRSQLCAIYHLQINELQQYV